MTKYINKIALVLTLLFFTLYFYAFLNGSSCNYSMNINNEMKNTFLTCYRGKVVALHVKKDSEGNYLSQWKVEARQFKFSSQVIYFVYSRELIIDDNIEDSNDLYNKVSSGYRFLFYNTIRKGNKIYIFQTFPEVSVIEAKINGFMDFWESPTVAWLK